MGNRRQVEVSDFLDWMKLEPQSMVWIPVMHRLTGAEGARHHARCAVCRNAPIVGIRYNAVIVPIICGSVFLENQGMSQNYVLTGMLA